MEKMFGLYVTSNASRSHVELDNKTLCGIVSGSHKNDETRWTMNALDFKNFVDKGRVEIFDEARFCKKCLKKFDLLTN